MTTTALTTTASTTDPTTELSGPPIPPGAAPTGRTTGGLSRRHARSRRGEAGQTTVEYALVVLGAATVALLVLAWASGSGRIGALLDAVFNQVIGQVG